MIADLLKQREMKVKFRSSYFLTYQEGLVYINFPKTTGRCHEGQTHLDPELSNWKMYPGKTELSQLTRKMKYAVVPINKQATTEHPRLFRC